MQNISENKNRVKENRISMMWKVSLRHPYFYTAANACLEPHHASDSLTTLPKLVVYDTVAFSDLFYF